VNILDSTIAEIINNYKFLLVGIAVLILVRIIIKYRKKITNEYICTNCQTLYAERVPRNLFEKFIQFNNNTKKFKCLKCWNVYYVRGTFKEEI